MVILHSLCVNKMLVLLLLLLYAYPSQEQWEELKNKDDKASSVIIVNLTSDVIKDTDQRMSYMEQFKLSVIRSEAYEVGFVMYAIHENYRKMLDIYNTSHGLQRDFYPMELILMLQDVENCFWTIDHLTSMLHEIERKWLVTGDEAAYVDQDIPSGSPGGQFPQYVPPVRGVRITTKKKKVRRPKGMSKDEMKVNEIIKRQSAPPKPNTRWWWPIEYGWEIDYLW